MTRQIVKLFLLFILGLIFTSGLTVVLGQFVNRAETLLRITTVAQNLFAFMLPAVIVALSATKLPADMLGLRRCPSFYWLWMVPATVIVAQPCIEAIASLMEMLPWPAWVLAFEQQAQGAVTALIGGSSAAHIALAVCIVGVLPGLCEELFFRGALQGLLMRRPLNHHAAIWIAAVTFSLLHFQFVGFVPRVLLGAFFGYLYYWSESLWVPVLAHVTNNSFVVIVMALTGQEALNLGPWRAVWSAVLIVCALVGMQRRGGELRSRFHRVDVQ